MLAGAMPREAVSRHKLVQLVYDAILTEIAEGLLPPGSRLIQDELARAYGVSRQPVQQALLLLRNHGQIQDGERRGFVVAPLNVERVRDMYQVRVALDGLASRLAAQNGQERALTEGPAIIEAGRAALDSGSVRRMIAADTMFHTFVADLSGNAMIGEMMGPYFTSMMRVMAEVLRDDDGMPAVLWNEHAGLMAAIAAGRPDDAERLGRAHVEVASARILSRLAAREDQAEATARQRRVRTH